MIDNDVNQPKSAVFFSDTFYTGVRELLNNDGYKASRFFEMFSENIDDVLVMVTNVQRNNGELHFLRRAPSREDVLS